MAMVSLHPPLLLALLAVTAPLLGQDHGDHQKQPTPPPIHAPNPVLPPAVALAHVRAGNERLAAAREHGTKPPAPAERPSGAGKFVVAVITCAETAIDVAAALGLSPEDVLLVSNAGGRFDGTDIAMLERAAAEERLGLCIVLAHPGCTARSEAATAAAQVVAARRRIAIERASALLTAERLLAASDALRQRATDRTFAAVAATIDARTARITWLVPRADELPIAPVR